MVFALLLAASLPSAAAHHPADAAVLASVLAEFNQRAHTPLPTLTGPQLLDLAAGDVVSVVHRRADGQYLVVGLGRSDAPKEAVWLAKMDPHYRSDVAVEEALRIDRHAETWYHRIDLPAPFPDRHWVIDVWDRPELAAQTRGTMWERPWQLRPDGLAEARARAADGRLGSVSPASMDAAVATPVNEGALAFLDLPGGGSLFSYAVVTATGGGIPDRLVAEFMRAKMAGKIEAVVERSQEEVPHHYTAAHPTLRGGDGQRLAHFP